MFRSKHGNNFMVHCVMVMDCASSVVVEKEAG